MNNNLFYRTLLDMRGDQFYKKALKDLLIARSVAVFTFVGCIVCLPHFIGFARDVLLAIGFVVVGAAAAIDGGVRKRMKVWPLLDAVINWDSVENKACGKES